MAAVEKSDIFESKMSDVVAEMFARMAPHMRGGMKLLCGNLWLTRGLLTKVLPSVSPAAGAMLKTTLAFTMSHGSEGFNVLPQEAWVVGNMRFSHHQGSKASIEAVTELAKKYDIETEILSPGFASPVADYRGEPFRLVEKAIHAVFPHTYVSPYIMTGASDSRFFGRVCDDCIRFAPFLISDQQMGSMHGLNENVDVETLAPAVDFFKFIMREI
jgi:Acetylornithine deacetylase/Succinyl-diaminopimelate desuccinylase and related deacylases